MKIAIKANPSRGKEIISLLKSLGGINEKDWKGDGRLDTYYIGKDNKIQYDRAPTDYKVYTLEEFEKEFPFKVGDKVITTNDIIGIIDEFKPEKDYPYCIRTYDGIFYWNVTSALKPYKEMKEERNITLTLEKAKEWYKKGGELKEIALQAFTEKELNPLPRSWEEYCRYGYSCLSTRYTNITLKYDALIKLEQLRDCWRQGNIPQKIKYKIRKVRNIYTVVYGAENAFLSFCDNQTAEEFLKCFRDLIEQAGDLI